MVDRNSFRLSATLLLIGLVVSGVSQSQLVHPGSSTPTDQAQFAAYLMSSDWAAVHLVEFAGAAITTAGLLVLFFALDISQGTPRWVWFFAAVSEAVAVALAAVVYAVDGVALKHALDAWASAPAADKPAMFASAEALRWLETGTRSYQEFMSGLALVLFAITIIWTARVARPIGYLMGLSGLLLTAMSWIAATQGLDSATRSILFLTVGLFMSIWTIWLVIAAWRMKASVQVGPAPVHSPTVPASRY